MNIPRKGILKYVMFGDREFAVIFPSFLNHDETAKSLGRGIYATFFMCEPTSAGFCHINGDNRWVTEGRSETLNLDSDPEDGKVLDEWYPCG